eukprot:TRINITY_DN20264_c0_g1_i3.p1 TRINITY_DN20264_c0_g1~~TRINITY_DN20264_c0_g1_i3.p1  ORF type:complete len:187 (+),score=24.00 TRINITY_DN20264_c0_g1_i3:95-655(+)
MLRQPPRSTLSSSSAASDVYKRQVYDHLMHEAKTNPGKMNVRVQRPAPVKVIDPNKSPDLWKVFDWGATRANLTKYAPAPSPAGSQPHRKHRSKHRSRPRSPSRSTLAQTMSTQLGSTVSTRVSHQTTSTKRSSRSYGSKSSKSSMGMHVLPHPVESLAMSLWGERHHTNDAAGAWASSLRGSGGN